MSAQRKNRLPRGFGKLIAFSLSFERDNLLARGLGVDHLRELLVALARPLLRQGSNLAYAGNWVRADGNFTYELLRLVNAEKDEADPRAGAPVLPATDADTAGLPPLPPHSAHLYNHSAWPDYLAITPELEAQWINCCRIVRITPALAGIAAADRVAAAAPLPVAGEAPTPAQIQTLWQTAVCLSAMRRLATNGLSIAIADVATPEIVPPIAARIALGGKTMGYRGFLPGIFEEALLSLESARPLYLLGGFGGASEVLARALLDDTRLPDALGDEWQFAHTPALAVLRDAAAAHPLPPQILDSAGALQALRDRLASARGDLPTALNNGLNDAENRELLVTRDLRRAAILVYTGLRRCQLTQLSANLDARQRWIAQ